METMRLRAEPLNSRHAKDIYRLASLEAVARYMRFSRITNLAEACRLIEEYTAPGCHAFALYEKEGGRFAGAPEMQIKPLRMQRRMFREDRRELTNREYERLVSAAGSLGRERLALVMETVCAAGIRVGEVKYITVEAARSGRAEVRLKGKVRVILLPAKLSRKLLAYAKRHKITAGEVFVTRGGKSLSRKQIWAEMKSLCALAGVAASKVFPHNLRHLFARTFYAASRDVAKLADVLGHSSIETTRIYLISTGSEHIKALDRLNLVS